MKRAIAGLLAGATLLVAGPAAASGAGPELLPFKADHGNAQSLQRGARNFMNYCSGCHGMKHLRYNRMAQDLGIPEDLLKKNLMFTSAKSGDHILSAIPQAQAAQWFGQAPPDLTVTARQRGSDWIYTYLLSFYLDPTKATGVNNTVLPGASMPHVLWDLQGWQVRKDAGHEAGGAAGHGGAHHASPFELVQPGSLEPEEYRKWVGDLVNFMDYAAEPGKRQRISTGINVLLYLVLLTILTYLLKVEYWKDVH